MTHSILTNDGIPTRQAQQIARLLPILMRKLFTFDDDLTAQLSLAQLRVCSILREGPRPMSALSRELCVSLSAMTQIADRLERAQLVARVAGGKDRRVRHLQLTEHGAGLMQRREELRVQRVREVIEYLPPQIRQGVLTTLEALLEACGAVREQLSTKAVACDS